ncbi:hypothetical protein CS542_02640 [Pedobacter sp. IW39]|nr:hypothetical protein CS542_02640 [Pedobacter sp. IW39]
MRSKYSVPGYRKQLIWLLNFNQFADINSAYLNLFDTDGTCCSLHCLNVDYGIIGTKMEPKAYIYLKQVQRSEYSNPQETIEFKYSSAYAPIRNAKSDCSLYWFAFIMEMKLIISRK